MSIINAITLGGGSAWISTANTSASASSITFSVSHAPTAWIVFMVTTTSNSSSTYLICYIGEDTGTYYTWGVQLINSSAVTARVGTPTWAYSNGTFTVSISDGKFSTTVGDYVLVYI